MCWGFGIFTLMSRLFLRLMCVFCYFGQYIPHKLWAHCRVNSNICRLYFHFLFPIFEWLLQTSPSFACCVLRLKCDGTRAETRVRLSAKRTSLFKSAGALVQSTTGSRGVRISDSNAGYTVFRGSAKGSDHPLHSPVFPSLPLPCVTVCHHISTVLSSFITPNIVRIFVT